MIAMVGMGLRAKGGAVALAAVMSAGTAVGAPKCAARDEVTAIQAAAIQQELMVAALTCNQIDRFNAFQTSFAPELRKSDLSLERMFRRIYGLGDGEAAYHAFKTRLANNASMRSIHDNAAYCHDASVVFSAALISNKPSLAGFVSGIEVTEQGPVDSCDLSVSIGFSAEIPKVTPRPNPLRASALVAPAAASGSSN
jgi:hypothetical protein